MRNSLLAAAVLLSLTSAAFAQSSERKGTAKPPGLERPSAITGSMGTTGSASGSFGTRPGTDTPSYGTGGSTGVTGTPSPAKPGISGTTGATGSTDSGGSGTSSSMGTSAAGGTTRR